MPTLNERAWRLSERMIRRSSRLNVGVSSVGGVTVLDCGVHAPGGLSAGRQLARLSAGGSLAVRVAVTPGEFGTPAVEVQSDDPVAACLGAQYAGWQIAVGKEFAMGSGPMRAKLGREAVFGAVTDAESATRAVGTLESRKLPSEALAAHLAEKLVLPPESIRLAVAPCASLAGTVQVVARSLETALHKLHELKFDVRRVVCGAGSAPLPPVAADELVAVGRTNDAILYGGRVTLWCRAADDELAAVAPRVPSAASKDHGKPFAELFAHYGDFYKIDPLLFSPAEVTLVNLSTGRSFRAGRAEPALVARSFFGGA